MNDFANVYKKMSIRCKILKRLQNCSPQKGSFAHFLNFCSEVQWVFNYRKKLTQNFFQVSDIQETSILKISKKIRRMKLLQTIICSFLEFVVLYFLRRNPNDLQVLITKSAYCADQNYSFSFNSNVIG